MTGQAVEQAEVVAWLRLRTQHGHGIDRFCGISSDALTEYALGGPVPGEHQFPHDLDDLAACERTFATAPKHLRVRMEAVLLRYRLNVHDNIVRWSHD